MADYRLEIEDANAHLLRVTLRLRRPAARQLLCLPAWAPGSYRLRDFARQVMTIEARQGGRACGVEQVDKSGWAVTCSGAAMLSVSLVIHAFDETLRGAFLDTASGFCNGPALFAYAPGREAEPCTLTIGRLPRGWRVATSMPQRGRQRFEAADYAELIDHPIAFGRLQCGRFEAAGVEHEWALEGAWPGFDAERLGADLRRLCLAQIAFWHGRGRPPMRRYRFLIRAAEQGHGGLEHRESCLLAVARRELPHIETAAAGEDPYTGLLGLASHEYFHAWCATRMKPRELAAPDLQREAPTRLLWFFEGFTAYYDELMLLRAGLVGAAGYLRRLATTLNALLATPGRHALSVAQASFEAWTKHYQRDANTPNATVSYYDKGAAIALLCDLALRRRGSSLDAAMRRLWRLSAGAAIGEAELEAALGADADAEFAADLRAWVHGRAELPLAPRLAAAGVALVREP
ncbi:MAG: M61 family metallopeptidase, partial [Burkholderiales bacterium]|nr:M61 family metallopeptidase [Burkholderiales bacterium]